MCSINLFVVLNNIMILYLFYAGLVGLAYQGYNAMEDEPFKKEEKTHGNYVPVEADRPSK